MVKVCSLCGVSGWEELLSTCIKCESAFIHAYCTFPLVFDVPFDWVCEDCPQTLENVETSKERGENSTDMDPPSIIPPKAPPQVILHDPDHIKRYNALKGRKIRNTRYLDDKTLDTLGLREDIEWMAEQVGWTQFLTMKEPTYVSLTLEFLSSVQVNLPRHGPCNNSLITFRLNNQNRELTMEQFNAIFGFRNGGVRTRNPNGGYRTKNPKVFDADQFWYEITDEKEFSPCNAHASSIYNPCFRIMQRFMSNTVFARERNRCTVRSQELLHLWAMVRGYNLDSGVFLASQLQAVGKATAGEISIGGIVTSIARFLDVDMEGLEEATGDNRINPLCQHWKMIVYEDDQYKLQFTKLDGQWTLPDPANTTVKVRENWKRTFKRGLTGDSGSDQS